MISQLKLLRTPFQDEFLTAKDAPWPTSDIATVRTVGKGAGNMTFVLIQEAGHFVRSFRVSLVLLTMLMNKMFGFVDCSWSTCLGQEDYWTLGWDSPVFLIGYAYSLPRRVIIYLWCVGHVSPSNLSHCCIIPSFDWLFSIGDLVQQAKPSTFNVASHLLVNWSTPYFSFSIFTTLLSTLLIVFRISVVTRKNEAFPGLSSYRGVIKIVVESAMLYSATSIIFLILFARRDPVINLRRI